MKTMPRVVVAALLAGCSHAVVDSDAAIAVDAVATPMDAGIEGADVADDRATVSHELPDVSPALPDVSPALPDVSPALPDVLDASTAVVDAGIDVPPAIVDVPPPPVDVGFDAGPPPLSTDLADWLIQDVCVTAAGALLGDDPWDGCPVGATRRNLAIGEALPYHRHDQPGPGAPLGYQRHDSFPRNGGVGLRQLSTFDFAPFGEFNPAQDGYDALEYDGAYASIVGTRDPAGLAQTFFGSCRLDDAWMLAPTAGFLAGGNVTAHLRLVAWERMGQAFPGTCPSGNDAAYTRWALRPFDFAGIGGVATKHLDSLVVDHFGGTDPVTADHIERFYFTTAYGLTRWERWQNNAGTERPDGCTGATLEGTFRRVDCRDWTNVVPDATPYPPGAWPSPYVDGNLVLNHDFGGATAAHWDRIGAGSDGVTNLSIVAEGDDHHLATNCAGTCTAGQSVFQDVPRNGAAGPLRFGFRVRVEAASAPADLVVFERDAGGAIVARHSLDLTATGAWARAVSEPFEVAPATTQFRVQVYLNDPATFHVDDFWLAREVR